MKNKIIISSILTIAMCLSMIAGSTFALFTSESEVNVTVTSGEVSVLATAGDVTYGSTYGSTLGNVTKNGNEIILENVTPGDFVDFTITVDNQSTVAVKYRTVVTISGDAELTGALVVSFGGKTSAEATSDWDTIGTDEGDATVAVHISLPDTTGSECQGKTCSISYLVEAVQGNYVEATKVSTADELKTALENAKAGDVIDATDVALAITGAEHLNIPGGVTIQGATVNAQYRGGNYVVLGGTPDQQVVFENCTFGEGMRNILLCGTEGGVNSVVYNNCTFTGQVITNFVDNPNGVATFNNCTFTKSSSGIYHFIEAMGGTHIFNNCTFDYTGVNQTSMGVITAGQINVYSESDGSYATHVILNGCTRINCGTRQYGAKSTLTIQ